MSRVNASDPTSPKRTPVPARAIPAADNHPEHICATRSESHANADFVRPFGDRIRHHAVYANACEHQRDHEGGHKCLPGSFAGNWFP
jgi:hypothetical protein